MVFNLQLTQIAEQSNIIRLPSRFDARKPGLGAPKNASAMLEFIHVPGGNGFPKYKYPVRMFTLQPQE